MCNASLLRLGYAPLSATGLQTLSSFPKTKIPEIFIADTTRELSRDPAKTKETKKGLQITW